MTLILAHHQGVAPLDNLAWAIGTDITHVLPLHEKEMRHP